MMSSALSPHFLLKLHYSPPCASLFDLVIVNKPSTRRRPRPILSSSSSARLSPICCSDSSFISRIKIDRSPRQSEASDSGETKSRRTPSLGRSSVPLFVEMLEIDRDTQDREQAVVALWRYSMGGKKCVDDIMQFKGCLNLTVNLLKSESTSACNAAAGLLQTISSIDIYRDSVAESGAMEEILGLLSTSSLSYERKVQSLCTLRNLSVDERFRMKMANADILPLLVKLLDDEYIPVREAVGGVLENLALIHSIHGTMVEAGLIPKMAKILTSDEDGFSPIRKEGRKPVLDEDLVAIQREAKNVLLELAKNEYYKILIIEEGLVPVPLIGAAAYKSFVPDLRSRPAFPDGIGSGASVLLLGLAENAKDVSITKDQENALIGWSRQQFLARMESIENDAESKSGHQQFTLLPWIDGVARLVLILRLDDESAKLKAAKAIADVSISEHMRVSVKSAGGVKPLVRLLDSKSEAIRLASICALDKLCVSDAVCEEFEGEVVLRPLINTVKNLENSGDMLKMALNVLTRILDPSKALKSKLRDESIDGSAKEMDAKTSIQEIKFRNNVFDPAFITCLVEVLKTSSPDLQTKAVSILEFATIIKSGMEAIISVDIQSGLHALFRQNILNDMESDPGGDHQELYALKVEEAGTSVSAGARLLTKLLDHEKFRLTVDSSQLTQLLSELLKSSIPLQSKELVSACLVKLSNLTESYSNAERREVEL